MRHFLRTRHRHTEEPPPSHHLSSKSNPFGCDLRHHTYRKHKVSPLLQTFSQAVLPTITTCETSNIPHIAWDTPCPRTWWFWGMQCRRKGLFDTSNRRQPTSWQEVVLQASQVVSQGLRVVSQGSRTVSQGSRVSSCFLTDIDSPSRTHLHCYSPRHYCSQRVQ